MFRICQYKIQFLVIDGKLKLVVIQGNDAEMAASNMTVEIICSRLPLRTGLRQRTIGQYADMHLIR